MGLTKSSAKPTTREGFSNNVLIALPEKCHLLQTRHSQSHSEAGLSFCYMESLLLPAIGALLTLLEYRYESVLTALFGLKHR